MTGGMHMADTFYHSLTERILAASGMSDKILHVHLGLALFCLFTLLFPRRSSWYPLLCVLLLELGNEVMDRLFFGTWRWSDTLPDAANTLVWPFLLTIVFYLKSPRISPASEAGAAPSDTVLSARREEFRTP